jgi:hypothetical protein
MGLLHGRAGRLTAKNGGFRPGQSELALARGVINGAVMPYIALGQGWHRGNVTTRPFQGRGGTNTFDFRYDYDTALSAQLGAMMNRKEYEHSDFGPWERATGASFFTSAFWSSATAVDGPPSNTPGSLHTMKHFIAYVNGAAGTANIKTDDAELTAHHKYTLNARSKTDDNDAERLGDERLGVTVHVEPPTTKVAIDAAGPSTAATSSVAVGVKVI